MTTKTLPTILPYNARSLTTIHNDFKGLLYQHALKHSTVAGILVSASLSEANLILMDCIYSYDPNYFPVNTRDNFGKYLNWCLQKGFANVRRGYKLEQSRIPSAYKLELGDDLYSGENVNHDYGSHAQTTVTMMDFKKINKNLVGVVGERAAKILDCRYGLSSGGELNYRACGEILGISHEKVRLEERIALDLLKRKYWRDIYIATDKLGITPDDN